MEQPGCCHSNVHGLAVAGAPASKRATAVPGSLRDLTSADLCGAAPKRRCSCLGCLRHNQPVHFKDRKVRRRLSRHDPVKAILRAHRTWLPGAAAASDQLQRIPGDLVAAAVALNSRSAAVRRAAIRGVEVTHPAAFSILARGLRDSDASVHGASVSRLREVTAALDDRVAWTAEDLEPLVASLTPGSSDPEGAGRAVISFFGQPAVEPLSYVALNGSKGSRAAALDLLGVLGEEAAVEVVLAACSDKAPEVREEALRAIYSVAPRPVAIEQFLNACGDRGGRVHYVALLMLGRSVREATDRRLSKDPAISSAAFLALDSQDEDVARAARGLVGLLDDPELHEGLLEEVRSTQNWPRFSASADALVSLGTERVVQALISRLEDGNPHIRVVAARVLAEIGEPAVPGLWAAVRIGTPERRASALHALHSLKPAPFLDQEQAALVATLISESDESLCRHASEVLRDTGMPSDVRRGLLLHPDANVRRSAIPSLSHGGNLFASDILQLAKNDPDVDVRLRALITLHDSPDHETDRLICELLQNPNAEVRKRAIFACRMHRRSATTQALRHVESEDPDPSVRRDAANAVAEINRNVLGPPAK